MVKTFLSLLALFGMALSSSGCVVALAAGAGAVAADEINEGDGKFDPLEEAYDGDPSTAGPLDREDKGDKDDN
ncbi:MAG: hypothetical protein AAGD92_00615 [Pseudomonadota bacterium]